MKTIGVIILAVIILNVVLGGISVQYVINFWATYFQHKPVHVSFFPCVIAGLFLGEFSVPAAAITWLLSFVL